MRERIDMVGHAEKMNEERSLEKAMKVWLFHVEVFSSHTHVISKQIAFLPMK